MQDTQPYTTDDLARAVLLRIVPGGYRLIDEHDERFTGIRDRFVRLALKHLGGKPSLVGFCEPDVDARAAALALAGWASQNLVPTAIQRRVEPGVVVVVIGRPSQPVAGPVEGAPVRTTVWTAGPGGHVEAHGHPPGSPSPGIIRDAARRLERGEPAPGIGQVDYVERNLMYGRGRRARAAGLSGTAILLIVLGVFFGIRFLPGLFAGAARPPQGANPCAQGCTIITPAQNGARFGPVAVGQATTTFLFRGASACPDVSNPAVLRQQTCQQVGGAESGAAATYVGVAPGQAALAVNAGGQGYTVVIVVQ